jgi:hypothetical protein
MRVLRAIIAAHRATVCVPNQESEMVGSNLIANPAEGVAEAFLS